MSYDVERRVGGRFQEQRLRVGPHGRAPLVEVVAVHQRAVDAEARQQVLDDVAAGAEQRLGGHHVVAGLDLAHHGRRHGRHAGRRGAGVLGAFEQRHALLEHPHGGVREARVDEAGVLALEARLGGLGGLVDEALRQEQRFRRLAEGRAQGAAVDEAGGGAEGGELVGHGGLGPCVGSVLRPSPRRGKGVGPEKRTRRSVCHSKRGETARSCRRLGGRGGSSYPGPLASFRARTRPHDSPAASRRASSPPTRSRPCATPARSARRSPPDGAAPVLQPASLDLRLGRRAWRVRASFLPGQGRSVMDGIRAQSADELDLGRA